MRQIETVSFAVANTLPHSSNMIWSEEDKAEPNEDNESRLRCLKDDFPYSHDRNMTAVDKLQNRMKTAITRRKQCDDCLETAQVRLATREGQTVRPGRSNPNRLNQREGHLEDKCRHSAVRIGRKAIEGETIEEAKERLKTKSDQKNTALETAQLKSATHKGQAARPGQFNPDRYKKGERHSEDRCRHDAIKIGRKAVEGETMEEAKERGKTEPDQRNTIRGQKQTEKSEEEKMRDNGRSE